MAGLLRVTILNQLPATRRKLHQINANNDTIDAMLDELIKAGKVDVEFVSEGRVLYTRSTS